MSTIDDFAHGSDVEIEMDGQWIWCALLHRFWSGGWVRPLLSDGTIDNRRESLMLVAGDRAVRDSRAYKRRKNQPKAGNFDPVRDRK